MPTPQPVRATLHTHASSTATLCGRRGAILVECVIALALVAIAVTAFIPISRSALRLNAEAQALSGALPELSAVGETATLVACGADVGGGVSSSTPSLHLSWEDEADSVGGLRVNEREIAGVFFFSPLTQRESTVVRIHATGVCMGLK